MSKNLFIKYFIITFANVNKKQIKNKYFKIMKKFIFGLFNTFFGVLAIVFVDFDLYNTICNFGFFSAYFAQNPFADVAIFAIVLFDLFFVAWSFVGIMFMENKL